MNIKKLAHEQARYRLGNLWDQKINADTERCEVVTIKSLPRPVPKIFQKWRKWQPDLEHMFEIDKTLKIPCVKDDNWTSMSALTNGEKNVYQFCKQRSVGDLNTGMFNHKWLYVLDRHPFAKVDFDSYKTPFQKKSPVVFWRGTNTGGPNEYQRRVLAGEGYTDRESRILGRRHVITEHFYREPHNSVDIVLTGGKPSHSIPWKQPKTSLLEYIKHAYSKYKYMLYLEGNDIGSNVWWTYMPNCVVLRPAIVRCVCVYDMYLKPWQHYVPFDPLHPEDIIDKVNWCEKNTNKCLDIIKQANHVHTLVMNKELRHETYKIMARKIKNNLII